MTTVLMYAENSMLYTKTLLELKPSFRHSRTTGLPRMQTYQHEKVCLSLKQPSQRLEGNRQTHVRGSNQLSVLPSSHKLASANSLLSDDAYVCNLKLRPKFEARYHETRTEESSMEEHPVIEKDEWSCSSSGVHSWNEQEGDESSFHNRHSSHSASSLNGYEGVDKPDKHTSNSKHEGMFTSYGSTSLQDAYRYIDSLPLFPLYNISS